MSATKTIFVKCTYIIPVEMPADMDDEALRFHIEENGCPGTGFVGDAFNAHMKTKEDQSMCWACALKGENRIVPASSPDAATQS